MFIKIINTWTGLECLWIPNKEVPVIIERQEPQDNIVEFQNLTRIIIFIDRNAKKMLFHKMSWLASTVSKTVPSDVKLQNIIPLICRKQFHNKQLHISNIQHKIPTKSKKKTLSSTIQINLYF